MPSVVPVLCLALSLASLAASNRGVTRKLQRIEERVEHVEARQDRANIARREDKEELFLRLDDIEALVNSSESGRISFEPTQRADDESQRASEIMVVQKGFAEEKTRWRREVSKMESTVMDVRHEVKAAIEDSDRNVNNTIKSLKDSIKGNTDDILDEMMTKMDDTEATCSQNNMFVLNNISKLDSTLKDVKHDVNAVIETSDREVKHDIKSLNKSINGIKDAIEDSDRNVNNNIKSLKDSIKGNRDLVLEEMKTCEQNNKIVLDKLSNLERTVNNVMHEVKAVIESAVKHDVKSLNTSINGIKDDILDEMKQTKDNATATCSQNRRKLDSVLDNQSSVDKLLEEIFSKPQIFSSCLEIYRAGGRKSDVYNIYPAPGQPSITVYCDMDTDGGGWTVFQRRQDGSVDFFRNWEDYAQGFGKPDGEFWLGNEHISALTNTTCCSELRVDLEDFDGIRAYAKYSKFQVAPREDNFRLEVSGYSGNASDALIRHHSGKEFSTKDRDNDKSTHKTPCAEFFSGAWWFDKCYDSHLNGLYITEEKKQSPEYGVDWNGWKRHYSFKISEMKIRST